MATERIYSPDTSEPFDVTPSRASHLVLEEGWTRTPWTRQEVAPVEEAPRGGRGRRRRAAEDAAPVTADADEVTEAGDDDAIADPWRS